MRLAKSCVWFYLRSAVALSVVLLVSAGSSGAVVPSTAIVVASSVASGVVEASGRLVVGRSPGEAWVVVVLLEAACQVGSLHNECQGL